MIARLIIPHCRCRAKRHGVIDTLTGHCSFKVASAEIAGCIALGAEWSSVGVCEIRTITWLVAFRAPHLRAQRIGPAS